MYLLVQALQHLWLVYCHGVYQQFTYVGRAIKPGILSAWCWQISHCLTAQIRPCGQITLFLSALYGDCQKTADFSPLMNGCPERSSSGAEASFGIICHGRILHRSPYKTSTTRSLGMDPQIQKKNSPRQNSCKSETTTVSSVQCE